MTAQAADVLVHEGEDRRLCTNPLEQYWSAENPRPVFRVWNTSNWRGYIATWQLRDEKLWLLDIRGTVYLDAAGLIARSDRNFMDESMRIDDGPMRPVSILDLFPDRMPPILATWFSGELNVPEGDRVHYTHMGYESVYEYERVFAVEQGCVTGMERIPTGEIFRKKMAAAIRRLRVARPAQVCEDGRTTCPHCDAKFSIHDKRCWDGTHHLSCLGKIKLLGSP